VDDSASAAACKHCTGYMRHDLFPLYILRKQQYRQYLYWKKFCIHNRMSMK